jgi:hypothetical protein
MSWLRKSEGRWVLPFASYEAHLVQAGNYELNILYNRRLIMHEQLDTPDLNKAKTLAEKLLLDHFQSTTRALRRVLGKEDAA